MLIFPLLFLLAHVQCGPTSFSLRSRPIRGLPPQPPGFGCVENENEFKTDLSDNCRSRQQPATKTFVSRPRPRPPPRPQPNYGGGYYQDNVNGQYDGPYAATVHDIEPEDDVADANEQICGGGVMPKEEVEAETDAACNGCPMRGNNQFATGGAVGRSSMPPRLRLRPNEICQSGQGLIVVRLLSRPGEIDTICALVHAAPAVVNGRNKRTIAAIINQCVPDTFEVLAGGWLGDGRRAVLIHSPRRGVIERGQLTTAAVLCQS